MAERVGHLIYKPCIIAFTSYHSQSAVLLRAHSIAGALLRERTINVKAAYGDLSLFGSTVSLSVSSFDAPPPHWENVTSDIHFRRLDYLAGYSHDLPKDLIAESIIRWDTESGDLDIFKIPQNRRGKIIVRFSFTFVFATG